MQHRLETVVDLIQIAGRSTTSTAIVPGGHRVEDLRLVESARDHGIVDRIVLVGRGDLISAAVEQVGIDIPPADIVVAEDDVAIAAATVESIKAGGIDIVLKGGISTPVINRYMLPLSVRPTVSLATVFDAAPIAGGRPMVMTDSGVTTVCNFGRMVDLIRNAVDVARTILGVSRPRVAVLSANEKQIASLPSTRTGLQLARRNWPDAVVCGPLSFDLATDPASVAVKGMPKLPGADEVAGRADVLVCPSIDTANVLYKMLAAMNKYGEASLASITVGFPVPYIILSRSDSLETRLASIALCAVYNQRRPYRHTPAPEAIATASPAHRVLVVDPYRTSMKVAVYENDRCLHETVVDCDLPLPAATVQRGEQADRLAALALAVLKDWGCGEVKGVAAPVDFLPGTEGQRAGMYLVAQEQAGRIDIDHSIVLAALDHAFENRESNDAVAVVAAIARELQVPGAAVDPRTLDEFATEAGMVGYEPIGGRRPSHARGVWAAARRAAQTIGLPLNDVNLVVAYLEGPMTIAAVRAGKLVGNSTGLPGDGPPVPRRAGGLPPGEPIDPSDSRRSTCDESFAELTDCNGLRAYFGTSRLEPIEKRVADGDPQAQLAMDAMVDRVAEEIGKAFVAAGCDVEAIVLTGRLSRSRIVRDPLRQRVGRLAPVLVVEGSLEMAALAAGMVEMLTGRAEPLRYTSMEGSDTNKE